MSLLTEQCIQCIQFYAQSRIIDLSIGWLDYREALDLVSNDHLLQAHQIMKVQKDIISSVARVMLLWIATSINCREAR